MQIRKQTENINLPTSSCNRQGCGDKLHQKSHSPEQFEPDKAAVTSRDEGVVPGRFHAKCDGPCPVSETILDEGYHLPQPGVSDSSAHNCDITIPSTIQLEDARRIRCQSLKKYCADLTVELRLDLFQKPKTLHVDSKEWLNIGRTPANMRHRHLL